MMYISIFCVLCNGWVEVDVKSGGTPRTYRLGRRSVNKPQDLSGQREEEKNKILSR